MLQALTTPLFKSVVLGGVLLATGIGAAMTSGHPAHERRLVLDAPVVRGDIYLSAWDNAELRVRADRPIPLYFETAAWISDGCHWVGMETLEKLDDHTYFYSYDERYGDCAENARPYRKTPRVGTVTIVDE